MSHIIVIGASFVGLYRAIQLTGRGRDVVVIERDPSLVAAPTPDAPVTPRAGAPHAVQGHSIRARAAVEIRRALPDLDQAFLRFATTSVGSARGT